MGTGVFPPSAGVCGGVRAGCSASGHLGLLLGLFKLQAQTSLPQERKAWERHAHTLSLQDGALTLTLHSTPAPPPAPLFTPGTGSEGGGWAPRGAVWAQRGTRGQTGLSGSSGTHQTAGLLASVLLLRSSEILFCETGITAPPGEVGGFRGTIKCSAQGLARPRPPINGSQNLLTAQSRDSSQGSGRHVQYDTLGSMYTSSSHKVPSKPATLLHEK